MIRRCNRLEFGVQTAAGLRSADNSCHSTPSNRLTALRGDVLPPVSLLGLDGMERSLHCRRRRSPTCGRTGGRTLVGRRRSNRRRRIRTLIRRNLGEIDVPRPDPRQGITGG